MLRQEVTDYKSATAGVFCYQSNYEETTEGSNTKKIHYIAAPTGLAAMHIMDNTGNNTYTTITDHLGSLNMLIDDNGNIVAEQAYDAWGNARSASDWTSTLSGAEGLAGFTSRGFTLHEHLEEFNLIHMNGRVYCPTTMQFLSPDPYIQAPSLSHNYNRYSYCLNNPLMYSDPSGYQYYKQMCVFDSGLDPDPTGTREPLGGGGSGMPSFGKDGIRTLLDLDLAWDAYFGISSDIDYSQYSMSDIVNSKSQGAKNYVAEKHMHPEITKMIFAGTKENPYMEFRGFHYSDGSEWYVGDGGGLGGKKDAKAGGGSNLVDGTSFLVAFTSIGYSAKAYDTYNSSGWKNKSGRSFSSDLLKRGSNGKYIRGVQGYRNSANLAKNMSNSIKATGKAIGVLGVGITVVDAFSDGNLTWGDGAKIGIGLITTFTPIGWGYGIVDFGTYVMTGTSLTDRAGNYIDGL